MNLTWASSELAEREIELESLDQYRRGLADSPIVYRAGTLKLDAPADSDGLMMFVASAESPDRFGDIITVAGWQLEEFKRNPVFLWFHGVNSSILPLGTVPKVLAEGKELLAGVKWDEGDEFALKVRGKYQRKVMRAVSVGFRPLEFEQIESQDEPEEDGKSLRRRRVTGIRFKKQELLELSAVPVGAHPKALLKASYCLTHPTVIVQSRQGSASSDSPSAESIAIERFWHLTLERVRSIKAGLT